MPLLDEIHILCNRLAGLGWRDILLRATGNAFDLTQSDASALEAALGSAVPVDRSVPGFADFHANGVRAVEPGRLGHSLLYHALASPAVHPTADGALAPADHYPTLKELDTLENYIYSLVRGRQDLSDTIIAVFAYQYRVASRTSHLTHADVAYSRTGISRVGTASEEYDPARRSFWVQREGGEGLPVLPARYAVFLARRGRPGSLGSVQGGADGNSYVFPVHKLFSGDECLEGHNLSVDFGEYHRTEKLRMTHRLAVSEGGLPVPAGFDIDASPYVRDTVNGARLVSLEPVGASTLVIPTPAERLVRTVAQRNSRFGRDTIVHFQVPRSRTIRGRGTRYVESTLQIPAFGDDRLSPEYVNIRHEVDPDGPPDQTPVDLNGLPPSEFESKLREGGYAAAHFVDDTCEGCVEAIVNGLPGTRLQLVAFSLVTAPDFFPLADQIELEQAGGVRRVDPLSRGRLPVNPTLPRVTTSSRAFDRADRTVTAVVGEFEFGIQQAAVGVPNHAVSFLPDSASDVFAPGWDISRSRDVLGAFLTSSGLGSPFPEDAKLCAALGSFWPAVAPDNGRTFGNQRWDNQVPMLDAELGLHPDQESVASGGATSELGWDGEHGPFFVQHNDGSWSVNYVDIARSDYVSHALADRVTLRRTATVQSEELILRHRTLQACFRLTSEIQPGTCLVVFKRVADWPSAGGGRIELVGGGYLLEFAELAGPEQSTGSLRRVTRRASVRHTCQVGENGIAYRRNTDPFRFSPH